MIDKTIKNIKKYFTRFQRGYLQKKYQKKKKKTLQGFEGDTYSKNSSIKKFYFFFVFPIYKRARYKNGCYYQRNV